MQNIIESTSSVRALLFKSPAVSSVEAKPPVDLSVSRLDRAPLEHRFYRGLFPVQIPKMDGSFSLQSPKFFFRGGYERDKRRQRKNPYLIEESFEEERVEVSPKLQNYLERYLPLRGRWAISEEGLVYLNLDDRFIHGLYPLLEAKGAVKPPYFAFHMNPYGAHSPILLPHEVERKGASRLNLNDKEVEFTIKGVYSVRPHDWEGVDLVWFLKIASPKLEALRQQLFYSPKLGGHDFHVVIALLPAKPGALCKKRPPPKMRINPAYRFI